jgi:hypothetical protein
MKCSECEYAKKVTMPFHGVGSSWRSGNFMKEGYRCDHPSKNRWYDVFYGKTVPKDCPLKAK